MHETHTQRLPRTRTGGPRLRCTDDVLRYWVERVALVAPAVERFNYASMICEGDSLYHYGHHFELARIIRDRRGRTKLVLLNGDSWPGTGRFGPSTASRQADVRREVSRTDAPSMVVPFSALDGAGVDFDTIAPIHVRDDRHTVEEHSSRKQPDKKLAQMPDPSGATRMEDAYERDENGKWCKVEREVPVYVDNPNQTAGFRAQHGWCDTGAKLGEDGVWRWQVRRHWLGDSLFRARSTESRTRRPNAEELATHERLQAWNEELGRFSAASRALNDGPRPFETHRAYVTRRRSKEPSNYGHMFRHAFHREGFQERLSELYERQPSSSRVNANGRVQVQVTRWATFLSSFDYQEPQALYFLCELPYGSKATTVEDAIQALKPPEVIAAEARGLNVVRQGDLFAIPTKLTKRQIRRMRGRHDFTNRLRVLGTNHSAKEGIVCKGGAVLGRGVMRHEPDGWRAPDHIPQQLGDGKTWHLLVRNTVPRTL